MKKTHAHSLLTIGYPVLGDYPAKIFPASEHIRVDLRRAGIRLSHVPYISSMFLWTIALFAASCATGYALTALLRYVNIALTTAQALQLTLLPAATSALTCFTLFLYYPAYVAGKKGRELDKNLAYISNYMSIMANAGATVERIFQSLAENGELYGVRDEARNIIQSVEFLGQDIITSLDEAAKFSPSKDFAELLQGFITTMKTGGSLPSYLSAMSQQYIESRKRQLGKLIEQLTLAGEIYTSTLVALPIIFITMFTIMGFIGGQVIAGLSSAQLMPVLIYVLVPSMAAGVLLYIDAIMAGW